MKYIAIILTVLFSSCKDEEIQMSQEYEGAIDCDLAPGSVSICLDGPKQVVAGDTYFYAFKISKRTSGENINNEVNWSIEEGEINILDVNTEMEKDYTISIATLEFMNGFDGGVMKASSDRYNVGSSNDSTLSYITIPIEVE